MPTYEYQCQDCGAQFERILRLKEYKVPQVCGECHSDKTVKIITTCNFVLKGDGWPGKAMRVNAQMTEKHKILDRKQDIMKRESPGMRLAPNVNGEITDSWKDAQKLAASQGKDTQSYEPLVQKEKV